jgi:hypothetical protein
VLGVQAKAKSVTTPESTLSRKEKAVPEAQLNIYKAKVYFEQLKREVEEAAALIEEALNNLRCRR